LICTFLGVLKQFFCAAAPAHGVPRVKAELATEGGVRETGVAAQSAILGSNPTGAAVGPVEVKPSVADTIQTSGAYCSREENLKKEVSYEFCHFDTAVVKSKF
jgi:hypothetical protein